MNRQKKRNVLIAICLLVMVFSVASYLYLSKINIYRNINIEVYRDSSNVTETLSFKGYTVFNREIILEGSDSKYKVPSSTYLNRIDISQKSPSDSLQYNLKLSRNNTIILDTLFYYQISINSIYENKNYFEVIGIVLVSHSTQIGIIIYLISILLSIILFVKHKDLFIRILLSLLIISITIWSYYVLISDKFSLWAGLFSQITIFCILLLAMYLLLRKNHEKRKNILTSVTSVIITLFVAEIILRLMGYNATYFEIRESYYKSIYESNAIRDYHTHIENSTHYLQAKEYSFERKTNSLGLSDKELKLDTTKQLIIALGDSFTEGDGAHSDSTWLRFLEREYNSNEKHNYTFFNAGVCGSDPFYEYQILKDKLIEYQPEIVIVGYGYDLNDIIIRGGMERFESHKIALNTHWWEEIYKHSFTFRLIVRNILGYNDLLLTKSEYTKGKERALRQLKESINLLSKLSEKEGFELLIVFYPQKEEFAKGEFYSNNILVDYCQVKNINHLNLLNFYKNEINIPNKDIGNYYWEIDGHHNAKGYGIFAKGVFFKLKEMGY